MNEWINLAAVGKILLFGLAVGAAVPTLFAVGVRLNTDSPAGAYTQSNTARRRLLVGVSWVVFALVVAIVITGVLFIANNFIGHHTGVYLFGTGSHGRK